VDNPGAVNQMTVKIIKANIGAYAAMLEQKLIQALGIHTLIKRKLNFKKQFQILKVS